ncbi:MULTISPECIES: hypothetical protein [Pseudanabaena]|uniref:hypothetical protein n=1 Tax=Pseudanabaena TaxID=1152 RepID=UPI0024794845|nr:MULTISPECIES: hypothetical protein [Pseudanabaena]WGS70447.1 hypothetical protein OA858_11960 [Pseudanabaena galeata CCNP1313]
MKSRFRTIWTSILLTTPPNYADRLESLTKLVVNDSLNNLEIANDIDLTIVIIIIGAYWHQDLQEVRSRILALQSLSNADIQELVLAYAIALACRDDLHPRSFISQICHDFTTRKSLSRDPADQDNCLRQLQLAQKFVEQGASIITSHILNRGLSQAIASSLYYFLSTPHCWQIVTERARKHPLSNQPQVTLQSGAIASAYLGEIGNIEQQNQELLTRGLLFGDQLWAKWSGVFDCDR